MATTIIFHQWSPLHVAAEDGHDYTVEWLVKNGARIDIEDKDGVSVEDDLIVSILGIIP